MVDCEKDLHIDLSPLVIKKFHQSSEKFRSNGKELEFSNLDSEEAQNGDIISMIKKLDKRVSANQKEYKAAIKDQWRKTLNA